MKVRLNVDQLQVGHYIHLPLRWDEHPFLLSAFKIKNERQLSVVKNLGLKSLTINVFKSDVKPVKQESSEANANSEPAEESSALSSASMDELWSMKREGTKKLAAIEDRIKRSKLAFEETIKGVEGIFDPNALTQKPSFKTSLSIVSSIYQKVDKEGTSPIHLMNDSVGHERLHYHSLNVSLLSMLICQAKGIDAKQTQLVAFAGLYHDIGKIHLPNSLLSKPQPLEEYDEQFLNSHVAKGLKISAKIPNFPAAAMKLMSQHHERNDGSGFPDGLTKEQIHPLSRILILANAYDNLCNGVNTRYNPHRALSYLYNKCRAWVDEKDVMALISVVGIYPPGTLVELSDRQIGVVVSSNDSQRLSPYVLVYDPDVPREQAAILSIAEFGLSINKVIEPEDLTMHQNKYLNPSAQSSYFIDMD